MVQNKGGDGKPRVLETGGSTGIGADGLMRKTPLPFQARGNKDLFLIVGVQDRELTHLFLDG